MELEALNAETEGGRVILSDAEVPLTPVIVRTLALAIHELATNALKHGALSTENGVLQVKWETEGNEDSHRLRLEWTETLDPPREVPKAVHQGFGRELIERALPYQLGAETKYQLTPEGVRCLLVIPLQNRSD